MYVIIACFALGAMDLIYGTAVACGEVASPNFRHISAVDLATLSALVFLPGLATLAMGLVAHRRHRSARWLMVVCAVLCVIAILLNLFLLRAIALAGRAPESWQQLLFCVYVATLAAHGAALVYFYRMSAPAGWPLALRKR